ncbi:MAG: AAA family ATPase [Bacilli bacterium]|nr:AAA family ATPase [Bacilli bacterium]
MYGYQEEKEENVLEKYGRDITKEAKDGHIDPVIGRDEEIRAITRILSRRTKNNPVLIGEAGVGKTAIVEGLANKIVKGDVPASLKGKTLWELDMAQLVAGAKYRGEFEERLEKVLKEIKDSAGNIIMFIDEIHMIVGTGKTDGAMDTSNILKPMLARGDIHVVGATTLKEYREYIEKDGALERRFQKVLVNEPSVEDTITILRGIKDKYEIHHGVEIKDSALVSAATLSNRYITDRYLPDKAIDLIDEACSTIRVQMDSVPFELDSLTHKIMKLEIEKEAIRKEKDELSKKRKEEIDDELSKLKEKEKELNDAWEEEKELNEKINSKKKELDKARFDLEQAENDYDLENAAILKHGTIPKLEKELEELNKSDKVILSNVVTTSDIASVISKWTNIPVEKLKESEKTKLLSLEDNLRKRVIGQDEALKLCSEAVIKSRSGIKDPKRPIASFLFLGPTGVGKTEVARSLAYELFDDETHMIRIDMSEYMEKFSVSRLIGSPPGYVGYDEGGQLTEAVRRNPYSIVLFDEVEKAHPEVLNLLLQILDDGRCTDSNGRTVDFKNTIIIMTSNLGSSEILDGDTSKVMDEVKEHFRPEFINRLDEIIIFNTLSKDSIYKILDKIIADIEKRLDNIKLKIDLTDSAREELVNRGYDVNYGARPLKRVVSREVETLLSKHIINGDIKFRDEVVIDYRNNAFTINRK